MAQEVLPFPPTPSGSIAGRTIQDSIYRPLPAQSHLSKDAPNIIIVLIDDVGPGQTDTYGGEIHTPTLSRIANEASLTTASTPPRCVPHASGAFDRRNHQRVGAGQIAELANDWTVTPAFNPRPARWWPKS